MTTTAISINAAPINEAHHRAISAAGEALKHANEAGRLLNEAKAQCPHGEWLAWVSFNFAGSVRTAQRYQLIAKNWERLKAKYDTDVVFGIADAIAHIDVKKIHTLTVDAEFADTLPPLTKPERRILEASILKHGCLDAIVIWSEGKVVLDGHARYEICHEHRIPFRIREIELADRLDAIHWIIRNQLGRRTNA